MGRAGATWHRLALFPHIPCVTIFPVSHPHALCLSATGAVPLSLSLRVSAGPTRSSLRSLSLHLSLPPSLPLCFFLRDLPQLCPAVMEAFVNCDELLASQPRMAVTEKENPSGGKRFEVGGWVNETKRAKQATAKAVVVHTFEIRFESSY